MSFPVIVFVSMFFFSGFLLGFFIRGFYQKDMDRVKIYHEALRIFYRWKNEIGGVSLKGVGANYERWILEKIQEASINA